MRGELSRVSGDIEVYLVKYPGLFLIPYSYNTTLASSYIRIGSRSRAHIGT
jgi:hypothetical protein